MSKIDYDKLRALNEKRRESGRWSLRLINQAHTIVAMKSLGFRCTEIVDFLLEEFPEFKTSDEKNALNNNKLYRVIERWKKQNLIIAEKVKQEIALIEGIAGHKTEEEFI